ncbi:MAG: CoA pyrophosphatase [Enterobacteriaceae bacterium]
MTLDTFISRFLLCQPPSVTPVNGGRAASVLLPIICADTPSLLLTRRASHLSLHPGQIAFPGGMTEPQDQDLNATALREANEEIGLPAQQVQIIGHLPAMRSSSGFQVTPVVGLIPPDLPLVLNQDEVSDLLIVPLQQVVDLDFYATWTITRANKAHQVYFCRHQPELIWGLTALIMYRLAHQVVSKN